MGQQLPAAGPAPTRGTGDAWNGVANQGGVVTEVAVANLPPDYKLKRTLIEVTDPAAKRVLARRMFDGFIVSILPANRVASFIETSAGVPHPDDSPLDTSALIHLCSKNMKGDYLGEFEELVLLAVRRLGETATGSTIQALLEREAGRRAALGAIYAVLDRAERKGWTESWLGEPVPEPGGRRRRHYGLTGAGETALEESRRVRNALWQRSPRPAR